MQILEESNGGKGKAELSGFFPQPPNYDRVSEACLKACCICLTKVQSRGLAPNGEKNCFHILRSPKTEGPSNF